MSLSHAGDGSYRLLLVALSICSSRALLAPDDHHPIILRTDTVGREECCSRTGARGRSSWGRREVGELLRGVLEVVDQKSRADQLNCATLAIRVVIRSAQIASHRADVGDREMTIRDASACCWLRMGMGREVEHGPCLTSLPRVLLNTSL
jgi:hypothetical protein